MIRYLSTRTTGGGAVVMGLRRDVESRLIRAVGVAPIYVRGRAAPRLRGGYRLRGLILAYSDDALSIVFGRHTLLIMRVEPPVTRT